MLGYFTASGAESAPAWKIMAKILDCTLRDGGLVNDSNFSDEFARAVLRACEIAGVDTVEIGFKNSKKYFSPEKFGKWRFCEESDIRETFGDAPRGAKLCALMDAGKCDISALPPRPESIVSKIRCAFYADRAREAAETLGAASELGYETSACLMAAPQIERREREKILELLAASKAGTIYLMDSFGTLLPAEARKLCAEYSRFCRECGKTFGAHFHNNLQCAFANSIIAAEEGADVVDSAIGGLGKGAGNCPTELLAGFLLGADAAVAPSEAAEKFAAPLAEKFKCGFRPQYMLTALLKIHPRPAMEYSAMPNPPPLPEFYEKLKENTK